MCPYFFTVELRKGPSWISFYITVVQYYRECWNFYSLRTLFIFLIYFQQGTDPEDVIKNAFGCFDENNQGYINEEYLRELLVSMGDRFTDEEVSIVKNEYGISYVPS